MDACEASSPSSRSIDALPLWALISAWAASPRCLSRQTRMTKAPREANPNAVALPRPELAPVIRQTLPCMVRVGVAIGLPSTSETLLPQHDDTSKLLSPKHTASVKPA